MLEDLQNKQPCSKTFKSIVQTTLELGIELLRLLFSPPVLRLPDRLEVSTTPPSTSEMPFGEDLSNLVSWFLTAQKLV